MNEISEWKIKLLKNEKCIICGKEVNINQSGKVIPFTKRIFTKKLYFCSEECYAIWSQQIERQIKEQIKEKRKKINRRINISFLLELVCVLPIMVIVIIVLAIICVAGG